MDEANRKNPLETDGRNPLPEHLAARERALYEAAGCRKYHMGRFEEYSLYQANRKAPAATAR